MSLLKAENSSLTHDDIEQILERTALDIEGAGYDNKTGHGFLDAQAAVNLVQNNDVVHKTVTNADIDIISDVQLFPPSYLLGSRFLSFTNYNAFSATGKAREITGSVYFDNVFSSVPEAWLRLTSTGTDFAITGGNEGWYDPYDKDFEITSISTTGFTFTLFYWDVTFYNSTGAEVDFKKIPDIVNNLNLDYTVVGQETSNPVIFPSAPTNLAITNAGTGMGPPMLDWDDNSELDLDYYEVWRRRMDYSSSFNLLATTSSSSYMDGSVDMNHPNEEFRYQVKAVNTYDLESDFSNVVSIMGSTFMRVDSSTIAESFSDIPDTFEVNLNYPNPFSYNTTVRYGVPEQCDVSVEVYNILGQKVRTLVIESKNPGYHTASMQADGLASGIYICRFKAIGESGEVYVKDIKMQVIK